MFNIIQIQYVQYIIFDLCLYRKERQLAEVHDLIKTEKTAVEEPPKALRFLTKIEKPVPRPPTPSVELPSPDEEERELGVIFLQQVQCITTL